MREQRRLAAIVSADVAGYSRLMGQDESGTLAALKSLREELIDPKIAAHGGRIVKTTGDGLLLEFASIVDAVRCVIEVQTAMATHNDGAPGDSRIDLRIGINLGDIIVDSDDIFGDGVNIAARLQEIARPGGMAFSRRVHEDVRDRLDAAFEDGGELALKNIVRPVHVWRWSPAGSPACVPTAWLSLPDKPSIAVLPFTNMSGDPEQEYFADGVVEDILTALSRVRWLFVIARNSSFAYKGRAVDVKQVGRELGVRYLLEGSIRKAANRLRITGQLIDTATGAHLWADRFEGTLEDVFDLQDRVTASVVGAIAPQLEQAEIVRAKRKPTGSLVAYDHYLRGIASFHVAFEGNKEAMSEALRHFYRVIELDPEYASAYGMAAWCHVLRGNYWQGIDDAKSIAEAHRLAEQAVHFANEDAVALFTGGFGLARVDGYLETGAALIDRALAIDPNLAAAWHLSGWVRIHLGDAETAIEHFAHALRLNPLDPLKYAVQNGTAAAHLLAGRYDDASSWSETALRVQPSYLPAMRVAAASHALAGRLVEARKFVARICLLDPDLRIASLADVVPFRGSADIARYVEGLRQAGLPE
jgi:TolB-like protein/class 3 adenylate cyclase